MERACVPKYHNVRYQGRQTTVAERETHLPRGEAATARPAEMLTAFAQGGRRSTVHNHISDNMVYRKSGYFCFADVLRCDCRRGEGLLQISDKVSGIFNADGQAYEVGR